MLALENKTTDTYVAYLEKLGGSLPIPKAILSIWAHFYGPYEKIDVSERPETLYDFYGFPEALHQLRYPAPGYPEWAELIRELIPELWYEPVSRWFDHGTWSVLIHLFPQSKIPVFSLSIDSRNTYGENFELWKRLRILRDHGILIIMNGNIVHNLWIVDFYAEKDVPFPFAQSFDTAFRENILVGKYDTLLYPHELLWGKLSVPTHEHYAPAIIALGTAYPDESAEILYAGFELGSIWRLAFGFGVK